MSQGDSLRTNIQLDFGDGTAVSYSNLSWTEEGIKHVYKSAGIFRVTALAENTLGSDTTTLYLHVTCEFSQNTDHTLQRHASREGRETESEKCGMHVHSALLECNTFPPLQYSNCGLSIMCRASLPLHKASCIILASKIIIHV